MFFVFFVKFVQDRPGPIPYPLVVISPGVTAALVFISAVDPDAVLGVVAFIVVIVQRS